MTGTRSPERKGFFFDIKVLELADHRGEFCGKLVAGVGADVVKVEPPSGSPTRRIGPFYKDEEEPERSLHFWHYNHGKRGVTLDPGDLGIESRCGLLYLRANTDEGRMPIAPSL